MMLACNFKPLSKYPGSKVPWPSIHLTCGEKSSFNLNTLNAGKAICKYCTGRGETTGKKAKEEMILAGFKPLVKFPGYDSPWKSVHIKCGAVVKPRFHAVRAGGGGCQPCGRAKAGESNKTHSLIAFKEMKDAGLEPLEEFRGVRIAWKSRCLTCKKIVSPQLGSIRNGRSGCGFCAGNVKLEADIAFNQMVSFGARPIVQYKNANCAWKSKCLTCGKVITPKLGAVKFGQGACKYCAKVYVNPSDAEKLMKKNQITPLVPYLGSHSPWKSKCNKCKKIIYPTYGSIKAGGGCRYCAPTYIDPKEAVKIMRKADLEPLVPYINSQEKWKSRHLYCGRVVYPSFGNIRNGSGGCKWCGKPGLDYEAPSYLYVISHVDLNSLKVGIANDKSRPNRLHSHKKLGWDVNKIYKFKTGEKAEICETDILRFLRKELVLGVHLVKELMPQGGHTETLDWEDITLVELTKIVEKFVKLHIKAK